MELKANLDQFSKKCPQYLWWSAKLLSLEDTAADWNSQRKKWHGYYLKNKKNPKNLSSNNFRLHISSNLTCIFQRKSCNPLLSNCFFKHLCLPWRLSLLREPALWMSSLRATVSGSQISVKCAWGYPVGSEKDGFFWNFFQNYVKKKKPNKRPQTNNKKTHHLAELVVMVMFSEWNRHSGLS